MRVAILSSMESVPWVPIVAGLLEGFRDLGYEVQGFPVTRNPGLHALELVHFEPDLALFPCQRREWALIGPYLEVVNGLGSHCRTAALTFDDPYDMETGLAMAQKLGFVFTPERLAVDVYERQGIPARHLCPVISTRLHHPPSVNPRYSADVLQVGGTHWRPRNKILPEIRDWCARHQKRYAEVAGGKAHGWLVGETFTKAIHESRVVLEVPRFDLPTQTNPHQVPCTYTSPRVYIVAACGGLPLVIGKRADLDEAFPRAPRYGQNSIGMLELLEYWCDPEKDAERLREGARLWSHFIKYHRPDLRAAQIVRDLELGDPTPRRRVARAPAPFEPPYRGG